jgi:hypothetical protein
MRLPTFLRAASRLASLRPAARRYAARAWILAPLIRGSLALLGFRATLRWVEAVPVTSSSALSARASRVGVDEGASLVEGAFRAHVVGGECLERALVQYLLHRLDGVPARLVLGVKRPGGQLDAHAWVEALGSTRAPTESDHPPFVPLFVSEATGRGP